MDIKIPPKEDPPEEKPISDNDPNYYNFPCPKCKARKVKRIIYGYIDNPNALSPREVPGGCCIGPDSHKWYCENCHHEWGRTDD